MASETQTRPRPLPYVAPWPPNDTEESILGTNLHQTTITNVRWGANEAARVATVPGQPIPWEALSQTIILGCRRPDESLYRVMPDVFIYPRPIEPHRGSVTLEVDGPPVLIIEVLSDSTYEGDLDLAHGKGYSYARAGVHEYLALDPTGAYLPEGIRAWRLNEGIYRPWEPDSDGRWHSDRLDLAFGLEGALATVYACGGRRMLHEGEVEAELERLRHLLDARQET